jgi:DNA polymerase-3 subunit alpha
VDDAIAALQKASRVRESGQHGLFFGGSAAEASAPFLLKEAPLWSEEERLASEYAMLGFYVSGHPLEKYSSRLAEWNVVRLEEIEGQRNGKEIAVAALVVGVRAMRTKKGARWGIFTIQDMTGVQELLAFPESFAKHEQTLKPGAPLLLKVRVQIEEAGTRLSLQEARRIQDITERAAAQQEFRVRLSMASMTEGTMDRLEELFNKAPGMSQVVFELESSDGTVAVVASQQRVKATPELLDAVRQIHGKAAAA